MGKDIFLEYFDVYLIDDRPLKYGVGTIFVPTPVKDSVFSLQQDNTLLKKDGNNQRRLLSPQMVSPSAILSPTLYTPNNFGNLILSF